MGSPSVGSKGNWSKLHATRDTQTNSKERGGVERERSEAKATVWGMGEQQLLQLYLLPSLYLSLSLSLSLLRRACLTCHYLMRVHKKLNQNALHALEGAGFEVDAAV